MTSNAAKAAAIMQHVCGIEDMDKAAELYDEIGGNSDPIDKILEAHGLQRWAKFAYMDDGEFWEYCIEANADIIDAAIKHFKEKANG